MLLLLFYLHVTVAEPLKRGHFWVQRMCPLRNERCSGWDHDEVSSFWRFQEVSASGRHPPAGGICLQEVPACGSAHVKGGGAAGVVNLGMRGVPAGTMMKSPAIGNGRRCPPLEGVHLREASACGRCLPVEVST